MALPPTAATSRSQAAPTQASAQSSASAPKSTSSFGGLKRGFLQKKTRDVADQALADQAAAAPASTSQATSAFGGLKRGFLQKKPAATAQQAVATQAAAASDPKATQTFAGLKLGFLQKKAPAAPAQAAAAAQPAREPRFNPLGLSRESLEKLNAILDENERMLAASGFVPPQDAPDLDRFEDHCHTLEDTVAWLVRHGHYTLALLLQKPL